MERYSMFLGWKNQYCENGHPTQSNLQIQCNPYQITHDIVHRTNNPNIYMEQQKTQNRQSNPEKQKPSRRHNSSRLQGNITKPQTSRQCGTGTKTDIQTNGTEQRTQK